MFLVIGVTFDFWARGIPHPQIGSLDPWDHGGSKVILSNIEFWPMVAEPLNWVMGPWVKGDFRQLWCFGLMYLLPRSRECFLPFASKTTTSILASFLTSLYAADKPETPPPTTTTSTSSLEFILPNRTILSWQWFWRLDLWTFYMYIYYFYLGTPIQNLIFLTRVSHVDIFSVDLCNNVFITHSSNNKYGAFNLLRSLRLN